MWYQPNKAGPSPGSPLSCRSDAKRGYDGAVRSVRGALSAALAARDRGITVAHKSGSLGIPLGGIAFWSFIGMADEDSIRILKK